MPRPWPRTTRLPLEKQSLTNDDWTRVVSDLSAFAGKTVDRIDLNVHNDGANGEFRGQIDEVIVTGVATIPKPKNLVPLDANWTPQWSHIMGYWNFDGTSLASVPNGTHLPGVVGPDLIAQNSDGKGMHYVNGQVGQGLLLDGVDDYFRLPNDFAATNRSLSFWTWRFFSGDDYCQNEFTFIHGPDQFYTLTDS